jgi:molecular chaperone GrpE
MEKEQSQNNPKNISEKEEEVKTSSDQTSEDSQADELAFDGSSQNPSEETKEEEKRPEEKILELEDKLARTFAEMENQRRRFEKEKEDAYEYGGFAFAKEALNLIDNLERSKQILSNDESLKNSESLKKTLEHFDIINKDLISVFSKNNIKPIESLNKKLDPNFHQAMIEIEDDEKEPGTIIQEIQKGFTIKDRLLRPSLVGVAKKRSDKTKKDKENKDNLKEK